MTSHATMPEPSRRTLLALGGGALVASVTTSVSGAETRSISSAPATRFAMADVDGLPIFYREAGSPKAPVVVLLHGFPTSSRMYRNFIPLLAERYRVIAPDYPAFGHSAVPSRATFQYSHAHLSDVMERLLRTLRVERFALYLMDFGGPIGYRLMLKDPDRVTGVVVQNTPIFGEPTGDPAWATALAYWKDGSPAHREAVRVSSLTPAAVRNQYLAGVRGPSLIDPDCWTIDSALLARPGVEDIMLDLLYDIRNNRQTVADARRFFGANQSRLMIATGANDPLFPGASMRPPADMPDVAFHPIDSGHFALEDRCAEIAALTLDFLARVNRASATVAR